MDEVTQLKQELERVRGLLQRTSENMEAMCLAIARNDGVMCAETVNMAAKLAISLRQGAESADIGKLDRVDKKYLHAQAWLCPEGYSSPRLRPWMVGVNFTDLIALLNEYGAYVAGSAETGGEKASDKKEKM